MNQEVVSHPKDGKVEEDCQDRLTAREAAGSADLADTYRSFAGGALAVNDGDSDDFGNDVDIEEGNDQYEAAKHDNFISLLERKSRDELDGHFDASDDDLSTTTEDFVLSESRPRPDVRRKRSKMRTVLSNNKLSSSLTSSIKRTLSTNSLASIKRNFSTNSLAGNKQE